MKYLTLGYKLPYFLSAPLFGDRKRFGLTIQPQDPCWQEWKKIMPVAYDETQKKNLWVRSSTMQGTKSCLKLISLGKEY